MPDIILGDFDSVNKDAIDYYRNKTEIPIKDFPPEKDETDTELAIRTAIEMGAEEIILFGATGTRVDHLLGNIQLLSLGLQTGVDCQIVDANNRIRLLTKDMVLTKAEQFGTYVSLIPLTTEVTGITLEGFKYPLKDAVLTSNNSLGVSNELVEDTGRISFKKGILILIESRD